MKEIKVGLNFGSGIQPVGRLAMVSSIFNMMKNFCKPI